MQHCALLPGMQLFVSPRPVPVQTDESPQRHSFPAGGVNLRALHPLQLGRAVVKCIQMCPARRSTLSLLSLSGAPQFAR